MTNKTEFERYLKRPVDGDNERRACANINSDNPMGAMLNYGAALSKKEFLKDIPEKFALAHTQGYIHIHDLDFYDLTTTCCQISLDKLFTTGFGNMRPPKRIMAAFMQLCIAIQSNQNDQYGGQAIVDYDIAMGRLIARAHLRNIEMYGDLAFEITKKEVRQGAESMIHNLNTMNSRAGAQVPFSSINYGMGPATLKELGEDDAAVWASELIISTLEATMTGLANSETPRYPIQIYRVKKGINLDRDDPYYHLTRRALLCTAKRAYPNYGFLDNTGNDDGFELSDPTTHVGFMGCNLGDEVIVYRDDRLNIIYCESMARAYDKHLYMGGEYSVWDSYNRRFSKIKTWIKNPMTTDFWNVKISGGRRLTLTSDHPLPIENKGRTLLKDVEVGDEIQITSFIPSGKEVPYEDPWFIGFTVCDASYAGGYMACVGMDETEICDRIKMLFPQAWFKEQHRGEKGDYIEIHVPQLDNTGYRSMFGGIRKIDRHLPSDFLMWEEEARLALLAGIVDADGYVNPREHKLSIGSTNKELALQELYLCLSLTGEAQIYENHYNGTDKIRYAVYCDYIPELDNYLALSKKIKNGGLCRRVQHSQIHLINSIEKENIYDHSYDLETETDRFDLSGVYSHNCRTRVYKDIFGKSTSYGRGNASFCTINLPRLGILSYSEEEFYSRLKYTMTLVADQLQYRFTRQCKRPPEAYPSLVGDEIGIEAAECKKTGDMWPMLKHFTLSIGFVGMEECVKALELNGVTSVSKHDILDFMDLHSNRFRTLRHLNYSLLATPAESTCERFLLLDKEKFGVIPGVTDKAYYTNSFHIPVGQDISAVAKIMLEGSFHKQCNAGHITYVELEGDATQNITAMEDLLHVMHTSGIGYGAYNMPLDHCENCHLDGFIPDDICPVCGSANIMRMRRITGYLAYLPRFNDGKRAEEKDRVKHDLNAKWPFIEPKGEPGDKGVI